jgi:glutathione S-transferase
VPQALDYLEREVPAEGFLFGQIGLADIALASFFRNADYAGFAVDPGRWPKVARFVAETLAHPVFKKLLKYEQVQMGSTIAGRRQALIDAGAKLTAETLAVKEPRRGIMRL